MKNRLFRYYNISVSTYFHRINRLEPTKMYLEQENIIMSKDSDRISHPFELLFTRSISESHFRVMQHLSGQKRCIFHHFSHVRDHVLCSKKTTSKADTPDRISLNLSSWTIRRPRKQSSTGWIAFPSDAAPLRSKKVYFPSFFTCPWSRPLLEKNNFKGRNDWPRLFKCILMNYNKAPEEVVNGMNRISEWYSTSQVKKVYFWSFFTCLWSRPLLEKNNFIGRNAWPRLFKCILTNYKMT